MVLERGKRLGSFLAKYVDKRCPPPPDSQRYRIEMENRLTDLGESFITGVNVKNLNELLISENRLTFLKYRAGIRLRNLIDETTMQENEIIDFITPQRGDLIPTEMGVVDATAERLVRYFTKYLESSGTDSEFKRLVSGIFYLEKKGEIPQKFLNITEDCREEMGKEAYNFQISCFGLKHI